MCSSVRKFLCWVFCCGCFSKRRDPIDNDGGEEEVVLHETQKDDELPTDSEEPVQGPSSTAAKSALQVKCKKDYNTAQKFKVVHDRVATLRGSRCLQPAINILKKNTYRQREKIRKRRPTVWRRNRVGIYKLEWSAYLSDNYRRLWAVLVVTIIIALIVANYIL